ncbi:uncharacterized protein [Eurosta solidaginis]|uniref:uncharacterized protein isoform X2 n=1 Tax=Eurosta solidaginis TaxID=178769 RepID=UPI003530F110
MRIFGVLYLGSAVPRQSKDGLQGIQEPLRSLYPSEGAVCAKGIDSWLSVWSNGILLENVDENLKQITRFFPIESLHYCAAVRQVLIPEQGPKPEPKFLPLDSPFARMPRAQHPPIFAAILRRISGIKVLECHVFICKREAAANALVRCCFHAYADNSYARQLETGNTDGGPESCSFGTLKSAIGNKSNGDLNDITHTSGNHRHISVSQSQTGWRSRAGSTTTLSSVGKHSNAHAFIGASDNSINGGGSNSSALEGYTSVKNFYGSTADLNVDDGNISLYNVDGNHKVWNGSQDQIHAIAIESPYEVFSGEVSTLGRPVRARQISTPIDVPPPPMREETNKKHKAKTVSKTSESQSLSGTLIRPKPIHPTALQRTGIYTGTPGGIIYGPVLGTGVFPTAQVSRSYHTVSHRGIPGRQLAPLVPSQIMPTPQFSMPLQMSVLAPKHYATLRSTISTKGKNKEKKGSGIPVGLPIVPSLHAFHPSIGSPLPPQPAFDQSLIDESRPLVMSNRKIALSMCNGLNRSLNSEADSQGGTGIYRRKGHINERAFSYSIRQEHRSRSHGSLACLQFNPPDVKKELEIAQMVAGLELNDGDEREMTSTTLHRKNKQTTNSGGSANSEQQAIHGNGASIAIYAKNMRFSGGYVKPRR